MTDSSSEAISIVHRGFMNPKPPLAIPPSVEGCAAVNLVVFW